MSEKGFQFRTAAFGGFRKEDVLAYLEQSSRTHAERINALQRELSLAKAKGAEDQEQGAALSDEVAQLHQANDRLTAELAAAMEAKAGAEVQLKQLQSEVERLRPAAEAYEAVKERTAGIELEAHGRAQAIEEEGRRKAKEIQTRVEQWFEKVCAAYDRMRGDLDATMNHAIREMSRTLQNLQDMSGDLAPCDQALGELRKSILTEGEKQPPAPLPLEDDPQ